jgi:hypothetical protein
MGGPILLGISTSDYIGRRNTYIVFFLLGILLYSTVPDTRAMGSIPLFVPPSWSSVHVRRRLRHHPGVSARYVRHHERRRHSRPLLTPGRSPACSARCWSTTSVNIKSTTACRRRRPTRSPCTSCAAAADRLLCNFAMRPVKEKYFTASRGRTNQDKRQMNAPLIGSVAAVGIPLLWGV